MSWSGATGVSDDALALCDAAEPGAVGGSQLALRGGGRGAGPTAREAPIAMGFLDFVIVCYVISAVLYLLN